MRNHKFAYVSDHTRTFGQDLQTCIGQTRGDLAIDVVSEPAKWQEHLAVLDRHEPFRDFVYRRKIRDDPERVISVSGNPLLDDAGRFLGYRGTARDITEKILRERAVQRAAAEAANLAKSRFLTNMGHELRTPLNAILGFSEVLENGTAGPLQSRQAEYVGLIRESSDHISHVINELLDLARIDAGNLELNEEVLEPRELVENAVALVRDRAAAGLLRLAVDIEEDMPRLMADRTRLTDVLLNLLSNAIKFTELGGAINVLVWRTEEGGAAFVVRDNGSGMTEFRDRKSSRAVWPGRWRDCPSAWRLRSGAAACSKAGRATRRLADTAERERARHDCNRGFAAVNGSFAGGGRAARNWSRTPTRLWLSADRVRRGAKGAL